MTPEGNVKDRLKKYLKSIGAYYHMPVQNGLGAPSLDLVCCYKGRYFAVETKAGSKQPTPRQQQTIQAIQASGGAVFLINELPVTWEVLRSWVAWVDSLMPGA